MADRFRAYNTAGQVVLSGDIVGDSVDLDTEDTIARVIFYAGDEDNETVCGSLDVGSAGASGSLRISSIGNVH